MTAYIPCYFNRQENRRRRFIEVIHSHLKFDNKIKILWMNEEKPFIFDGRIEYIESDITNASVARNKLLDIFYKSSEKYCILSDDDTLLLSKIAIDENDCVSYTNDYYNTKKETEKISSAFLVIKNIKQYFDESLEANQDLDFGINLKNKGYRVLRYSTNKVEIYKGESSMFKDDMEKLYKKQQSLNYIENKYNYGNYNT